MDLPAVLETIQKLREAGLTRAIGVCNFNMQLLKIALEDIGAPIACHQVEYHLFLEQEAMLRSLRAHGIPLVAYAPLAQGRAENDAVLSRIGAKHGVTAAQVAIAWLLDQPGVVAIPKAQRRESQIANLDALNIRLDDTDRKAIATLPKNERFVNPPFAPQWDA